MFLFMDGDAVRTEREETGEGLAEMGDELMRMKSTWSWVGLHVMLEQKDKNEWNDYVMSSYELIMD